MKTGVFGGTFNPIHNAHIRLAVSFAQKLALDEVILIPANIPPHKTARDLAPAEHRLAMCRLAVANLPGFTVDNYEIVNRGRSFTHRTLGHLREERPQDEFFLLMGADMFLTVQEWRNPSGIFGLATLCAASREPLEHEKLLAHAELLESMGARCVISDMPAEPMSSTEIRELARSGGNTECFLPAAVRDYILRHGMYR